MKLSVIRRYRDPHQLADRNGYVTLVLPGRHIRVWLFDPTLGHGKRRWVARRQVRRNRVARRQMEYALAKINADEEKRELNRVLEAMAEAGEIQRVGEDKYQALPQADSGGPEVRQKRASIQRMWLDDVKIREMAEVLGTTPATVGQEMVRMRRFGWHLPPRYPGWTDEKLVEHRAACAESYARRHGRLVSGRVHA